jgi:GTP-binding protein
MKITRAEFIKSAVWPPQYPPATLPEIAFAGRSNVGKSSLIPKSQIQQCTSNEK